jgi:uncharacterized iron-regulated membrane protein
VTKTLLRRLHRWFGLALALPLILQAITGLVLAVDPFVASLAHTPSARSPLIEPDDLRHADVAAILTAAQAVVPPLQQPRRWRVLPAAVVALDFAAPGESQAASQVAIDVASMRPLWVRQNPDVLYRWVHSLHETLLLGQPGRGVVGWIGVGLLLLSVSGIVLWWPPGRRWKSGFSVARGATGWRFQRGLHGAAGIWLIALLVLQSMTGIALAFPQTARAIVGLPAQVPRPGRPAGDVTIDPPRAIAAGIASAQAAVPKAVLLDLRLPVAPGRPMLASLVPPDRWSGAPGAIVTMDPVTARVLSVQEPDTSSVGASLLNWSRAVHEGGAVGPAGRLLLCLFSLALPLFPVTGLAMWTLRRRRRRAGGPVMAVRQ